MIYDCLFRRLLICESAGRAVDEKRYEYQQRRRGEAYGICRHDRFERAAAGKNDIYPGDPYAADADGGQYRRCQRNSETAQITAHDFIQHAENICGEYHDKTHISDADDFGIVVEYGEQIFARKQYETDGDGRCDKIFYQAQKQRLSAAAYLPRAVVLPDEGGARLTEGVQHIVCENFNIICRAGCRNDHRAEAVDRRLDNYV